MYTCNHAKYKAFCREAYIKDYIYQCPEQLTRSELAAIKAERAAAAKKKKEEEAAGEIEEKKAICKIYLPDCYDRGKTHKNYGDPSNACNRIKELCTKEENDKMCADAKKNKWLWQCR